MGNDGGSIPDRRDLVKTKAKAEQADKANQMLAKWFFCALSKKPLAEPIVSCGLGKLYNKDAVLEYLIDRTAYGDGASICGHIRSSKDVVTLNLTANPAPAVPGAPEGSRAKYVCPLTLKEMNGALPFVYLISCGCVFSASGLRAVVPGSSGNTTPPSTEESKDGILTGTPCLQCSKPYDRKLDVVTINPSVEEEDKLRLAMDARRATAAAAVAARKASKQRKGAKVVPGSTEESDRKQPQFEDGPSAPKRLKLAHSSDSSTTRTFAPIQTPLTTGVVTSVARKVAESLAEEERKRKVAGMSEAVASLYAPKDGVKKKETFMTMGTFTRYA